MHISRRLVAIACGVLLAPIVPLALAAPASAAAGCNLVQPVVVAADRDSATVKIHDCPNPGGITGYRIFAFENGSADVAATADVAPGIEQGEVAGLHAGSVYRFRAASVTAAGAGLRSVLSLSAPLPFSTVQAFATREYFDFTGVEVTAKQKADWVATVGAYPPTLTPVNAVDGLQSAAYWQVQSPVIRLFQAYFLRLPDLNGLNYWTGKSRRGARINTISSNFAGSSEFKNRYGALSNKAFVQLVYQNVLGRPGDPGGIASWTSKLDRKVKNRGEVMVGFSESGEYKRATAALVDVVNVFTGLVRRVPTAAERDEWTPQTRAALIAALLGSEEFDARVRTSAPPAIASPSVPGGIVGQAYGPVQLASTMGTEPVTWLAQTALPPGLSLSASGVLSGTPTHQGATDVGIRARAADGLYDDISYEFFIAGLEITTPAALPVGEVQVPYSVTLEMPGATGAISWENGGGLPPGLHFEGATLMGTPTQAGVYPFHVEAIDQAKRYATKDFTLTIVDHPDPFIFTPSLPNAAQGSGYTVSFSTTGGAPPYTFSIAAGSLPAGVTIAPATGLIAGTTTGTGTSNFTVRATDSAGHTGDRAYTVTVAATTEWLQTGRDAGHAGAAGPDAILTPEYAATIGGGRGTRVSPSGTASAGGLLYVVGRQPQDAASRLLMATEMDTGDVRWSVDLDPPSCDGRGIALTADAAIVACGSSIRAYALTGSHALLWEAAAPDADHVIVADTSVVAWGPGGVSAHDLADGHQRWHEAAAASTTASDVAVNGNHVVVAWSNRLQSLRLDVGGSAWVLAGVVTPKVVIAGGWVYTSDDGGVQRYVIVDGTLGWSVPLDGGAQGVYAVSGDRVYVFDMIWPTYRQAFLRALSTADGSEAWHTDVFNWISSVAVSGDVVWAVDTPRGETGGLDASVIAVKRTDGARLARITTSGRSEVGLTVAQGRVVVSGTSTLTVLNALGGRPSVNTGVLRSGVVGQPYADALDRTPYSSGTWSVAAGTLPAGLSLAPDGKLTGTPTVAGSPRVTFRVTDATGRSGTRALVVQVRPSGTASWTTTGGSAARDGLAPPGSAISLDNVKNVVQSWKTAAPTKVSGFSPDAQREPAVVGDRVIDTSIDGIVRAYATTGSAADRAALWQFPAASGHRIVSSPTVVDGTVYVVDDASTVYAVRAADGVAHWSRPLPSAAPIPATEVRAPLVAAGSVLVIDADAEVWAIDAATGALRWGGASTDLTAAAVSPASQLASDGTRAYGLVGCRVYAVTIATGAVAWSGRLPTGGADDCNAAHDTVGAPTVGDGAVFAGSTRGTAAFDAATGAVRWRSSQATGRGAVLSNGILVANRIDLFTDPYYFYAIGIDAGTGDLVWQGNYVGSTVAISGDLLVTVHGQGDRVTAASILNGQEVWTASSTINTLVEGKGRPVIAGGRIYVSTASDGIRTWALPG